VVLFLFIHLSCREGTVGTTKLTRKEILAEDPVTEALLFILDFIKTNGKKIAIFFVALALIGLGIYFGLQYLDNREIQAQEQMAKGLEFFHANISEEAENDPYAKGPTPIFKNDEAKYRAAEEQFSGIVSGFSYSKIAKVAQFYLGLVQLRLGENEKAVRNLEAVAASSRNRTASSLAKRLMAIHYSSTKNYGEAQKILEGLIRDTQCDLPKDELSLQLSRVLVAQGRNEEAVKVLEDANSQESTSGMLRSQITEELSKLQETSKVEMGTSSGNP
jgi:predicted negative regulator of RcsB-dependent stress response